MTVEIRQPTFDDVLHVAKNLRAEDIQELSATRDLSLPTTLATSAWCARYKRCAYWDGEPVFAFGVSAVTHDHGQAWGFGTDKSSLVTRAVTKYIKKTMVPDQLAAGFTAVQALGYPTNRVSWRWLKHLGFSPIANLAGIGAAGQDLILWVTTADEHRAAA
jgi:hypothetical protein